MTAVSPYWTHDFAHTIAASPAAIFAALTDEAALRGWLAEHAEVEARPGGAYSLWGRHTLGAPSREEGTGRVVEIEGPHLLVYEQRFGGCDSRVRLTLAPSEKDATETKVSVRHDILGELDFPRARELVDDHWRLSLGNLSAWLAGGAGLIRPDHADPNPTVTLSMDIAAPRASVWRALIEPESLDRWVASAAQVEPRIGGRYSYGWRYPMNGVEVEGGPSVILDLVEEERLVVDWPDWRGDPAMPKQRLTFVLSDIAEGTRLTFVHDGFTRPMDISDYPFGWGYFLGRLRETVTSRTD